MKNILIVCATGKEANVVKSMVKPLCIKDLNIQFFVCGMGMYETIFSLTKYLSCSPSPSLNPPAFGHPLYTKGDQERAIDFVVNIGVCGYTDKKEKVIQVGRIVNAVTGKEMLVPIFVQFAPIKSIWCSDKPTLNPSLIKEGLDYVDMESWAVEYVCDKFKIPRMILKVPVDKVGDPQPPLRGLLYFKEAERLLKENVEYRKLINSIDDHLKTI